MENLARKVAQMIINRCKLNDIELDSIDYDASLFITEEESNEGGFELDSVDSLELVAGVKDEFGITLSMNDMNVFYSVNTLTKYIEANICKEA